MQTKRETELDILRLLAILAVIMMHAGGNAYLSPNFNANRHSMFVAAIVNEFASFVPLPQPISHPYLVLVVLTVIIYAVSLALTWLSRKIPYVGKKIT